MRQVTQTATVLVKAKPSSSLPHRGLMTTCMSGQGRWLSRRPGEDPARPGMARRPASQAVARQLHGRLYVEGQQSMSVIRAAIHYRDGRPTAPPNPFQPSVRPSPMLSPTPRRALVPSISPANTRPCQLVGLAEGGRLGLAAG